ncbi:DUF1345 domain-containing protein [Paracoccus shanxieyensis]|uniref:DUF1345 domain-containing protein n=1 Tax=Paracoccus shanxieyensis TaxID=2675752 RepID=A0A6L6IZ21_9RHOB|nr:DUF1345 domain-containing protein [Paracoccus shanxieyensis]MTH65159.1 DUF1345 domain-containing protein [Paracoccus shanxieyensis]MTH88303.1 DUF1345 domain-containing protein [Paracoccus shanxieyensis]
MIRDLRHHLRFLAAFVLGLLAGLGGWHLQLVDRVLIFSVTFSMIYLGITATMLHRANVDFLRRRADLDDEGMPLIVLIAAGSVAISLGSILLTIADPHSGLALRPALALLSVPLGWAMIHTVMAFHYASIWYARDAQGQESRNLEFPGDATDAGIWDFLYYSFTLGMTAQTSDVAVLDTRARRVTMLHSAFSFFYNTVLLALAVNAGISLGQ